LEYGAMYRVAPGRARDARHQEPGSGIRD